jgi:formylmethanofuran dehydrogenase subunit C
MALELTARDDVIGQACLSIDLSGITPDRLADLPPADVASRPVRADGSPHPLGKFFTVAGLANDGRIVLRGNLTRVHHIAAGMASGSIHVDGTIGRHAGEGMAGGRLTVDGSAGDWLACGLRGGVVHVFGDAGDNAAAALPRHEHGVNGGTVLVEGTVGQLAGARMRRGILAVGGDCGEGAGFELRAGTVVVAGSLGPRAGAAMRRGSIVALGPTPDIWPGFTQGSVWQPAVVPMLLRQLARNGWKSPAATARGPWQHWHGDLTAGSRGELFCQPS